MERLKCDWKRADKECNFGARFLCGNSHVLCGRHAAQLTGAKRQRSTDRECLVCHSREIIDFLAQAREYAARRRAADAEEALSKTG